ncbi:MAG TPA: glycosyltransferase [Oscillatoriaceae cyanobacterium]
MPAPFSQLSLCMIVRDEAQKLARCLESAMNWVGEIVVVDTGSTDDTAKIAASFGAEVYHFDWCDDFSAARNAAIARATRDWVLMLDGDEELVVENEAALAHALADPDHGGYIVAQRNLRDDGGVTETPLLRLFRRRPEFRFVGRLHEDITPAIQASGKRVSPLDALAVRHDGYLLATAQAKQKGQRNFRLALQAVEAAPESPTAWSDLGRSALYHLAAPQETCAAFAQVERLLAAGHPMAELPYCSYALLHARLLQTRQRHADAIALLERALRRVPGFPEFHYERGRARAVLGDIEGARADFAHCLEPQRRFSAPIRQGVLNAWPREALARLLRANP